MWQNIRYTLYEVCYECVMLKYNIFFLFFCGCCEPRSWKCAHFNPRECEFHISFYLIILFAIFLRNNGFCDPLDSGNTDIIANAVRCICGRIPRVGGDIRCSRDALLPTHKRRCGGWWRTSLASPPRDTFHLFFPMQSCISLKHRVVCLRVTWVPGCIHLWASCSVDGPLRITPLPM